MEAIFSYIQT
jgi:hypothetical protein